MLGWREWNTIIHFWCKLVPLSDAITERSIAWGFLSALGASPMQRSVFIKRDRTHLCSPTTVRRLYGSGSGAIVLSTFFKRLLPTHGKPCLCLSKTRLPFEDGMAHCEGHSLCVKDGSPSGSRPLEGLIHDSLPGRPVKTTGPSNKFPAA